MKLELTVNGREERIEILAPEPAVRFRVGERDEQSAHVESPEAGVYSVIMEGRCYDAHVEETPTGLVVSLDGFRFEIEARDPRRWAHKSSAGGGADVQAILSPMPGKVVRVLVKADDEVQAGQGLVVVEAMKMQNEMKASRAGRILTITAREGATVAAGEILATIE